MRLKGFTEGKTFASQMPLECVPEGELSIGMRQGIRKCINYRNKIQKEKVL